MLKKLLATIVLSAYLSAFVFVPTARAQTWYSQSFKEFYTKVFDSSNPDEIFGERYTTAQVQWVIWGLAAMILNGLAGNFAGCVIGTQDLGTCICAALQPPFRPPPPICPASGGFAPNTYHANLTQDKKVGNIDIIKSYIANNNLSGIGYVVNRINRFGKGFVPEAKAQGFGFTAIGGGILELWKISRNITYFLLVFAMIIMSFMIMLRVKISPQTVITIQTAIPRVVIALILITFSFAIAGFLIDLTYVAIGLVAALFQNANIFEFKFGASGNLWADIFTILTEGIQSTGILGWLGLWSISFSILAGEAIGSANPIPILNIFLGVLSGAIITFVMGLIVLFISLRTIWNLILTFARIIILIITAPFFILAGLIIPGMGIGQWLKEISSNLVVYPVIAVLLIVSYLFLLMADMIGPNNGGVGVVNSFFTAYTKLQFRGDQLFGQGSLNWVPPLTTGPGNLTQFLYLGASLAIIAIIPNVINMIKGVISGQGFAFGMAIGEVLRPGWEHARGIAEREIGERVAERAAIIAYGAERAGGFRGWVARQVAGWGYRRGLIERPKTERPFRRRSDLST